MTENVQHCFLLDGKTILPINRKKKLFLPLKPMNRYKKKSCLCYQSINNNKSCQVDEEDLCSRSLHSITKSSEHYQMNAIDTYFITRVRPPRNSTRINRKKSYDPPAAINIIIKPSLSFENPHKRENSSLKSITKHRLSTFKDLTREIPPIRTAMILNENISSNILHSRTLLDIYRNKKQNLIQK